MSVSHGTWRWSLCMGCGVLFGLSGYTRLTERPASSFCATTKSFTRACTQQSVLATPHTAPHTAPLVFDGITVVDVEQGRLIEKQRIVIVGTHIQAMGSVNAVRIPVGARVVDARGKYVIPGLWDMHTHSMRSNDLFYPLFIANGVTGIRDASSPVPLNTLRLWQHEILANTRVGPPRQILAGKAIDEMGAFCRPDALYHICAADSADAVHKVDSLQTAGADFIKTWATYRHMWFIIAAEARRRKIPVEGHIPDETTAIEASDSGAKIVDHVDASGDLDVVCLGSAGSIDRCRPVVEHFRRNGTWWCPTLVRKAPLLSDRAQTFLADLDTVGHRLTTGITVSPAWLRDTVGSVSSVAPSALNAPVDTDITGFLHVVHQVGLPIVAGTDVGPDLDVLERMPPGFSLHAELALYVAEGMTPVEALRTATLNPAKYLDGTDSLGTVAAGKLADLVILDANPLADITNTTTIRAVVANGRYFDRAALDQLVTTAQAALKKERPSIDATR